jgi:hypothetical protein
MHSRLFVRGRVGWLFRYKFAKDDYGLPILNQKANKMIYNFDEVINRRGTHSVKYDQYSESYLYLIVQKR